MNLGLSSNQNRRLIMYLLPFVALVCLAAIAMTTDATLSEFEGPQQYENHATAYSLQEQELGLPLLVRKEGGGDRDYIKIPFLNTNDLVSVSIDQMNTSNQVEYWVEDPNHFPIYYYQYNGLPEPPQFSFNFAAIIGGPYFFYHGQGFGTTYFNVTFERVPIDPPPPEKDSNNFPLAKQVLTDGQMVQDDAGLPWDPSDFYYINIQPDAVTNKYLSVDIDSPEDTRAQWEIYDNAGIDRPSLTYTSDTWLIGDSDLKDRRVMTAGDYIFRIWMVEGFGQYNLTVSILSYPNDENNDADEATAVIDNDQKTGDVNLTFDREDWYEIYLDAKMPLWVTMVPTSGPADLYIFDDLLNQKDASRLPDLSMDHIDGWEPDIAGVYYIVVEAVYEPPLWENPPTVDYTLDVWINYRPHVVLPIPPPLKNFHMDEDTVNTDFDVTVLFDDADGDDLTYELDMSYNNTLIDIQLQGDNHLYIEPVANASAFKMEILLNATDPHGLSVNATVTIWIDAVNDGPYVDMADVPTQIDMGEDLVKSGVNVTKAFRDVDDDYSTWTFTATSADHINVALDEDTWLATLTPLVQDWSGVETFTVTCTDKGGETAMITFTIDMREINDPPVIMNYIPPQDLLEEGTLTIDLENYEGKMVFEDVEGKDLSYHYANAGDILVEIDGSEITFTGSKDFTGSVSDLVIWAEDDLGARSENMTLFFDVQNVNDPPELENVLSTATVQEGEGVTFAEDTYYTYFDEDSNPLSVAWNWYVDGEQVPPEQVSDKYAFEYVPPVTAEKDRTVIVKLEVIDGELAPETIEWTVTVTNLNVEPDMPVFTSDVNKTVYKEGEKITFSANADDLDGDELTYKWFLDELEEVGTGKTIELTNVKVGSHKISVEVTDPSGASSRADFNFRVNEKTDGNGSPGYEAIYVALALVAAVGIATASRRRR
jgi:hypothetical protein